MAKTGKKAYYWDTAAFIAWLDGGKGHPIEVIAGLDEIAAEINENRAVLFTSVLTQTELLQGMMDGEQAKRLQNLFNDKGFIRFAAEKTRRRKRSLEAANVMKPCSELNLGGEVDL